MRILWHSNAYLATHHRTVELLANAPDVDLVYFLHPRSGHTPGRHLSANGQRDYQVRLMPQHQLGQPGDPHRYYQWPPDFSLRQFQPHIIHCVHEQESLMTAELALARWLTARQSRLVISSWQNILRPRQRLVRWLSQFILHTADYAICASTEAVEVLRQQGFQGGSSIMPLGGLDTRYFYPKPVSELRARLGLEAEAFVVGNIGRNTPEKGLDTLVRAVALVANDISTTLQLRLVLVGNGSACSALLRLAHELQIADQCRFVDTVDADEVLNYMNLLDLFVLPSRTTPHWKEQFGRVLVEAMACKIAVVGSDSGAIPEVLAGAGRIFPEGNVAQLAQIIQEVAVNPDQRLALAEAGYRRALQHYTVEALMEKILSIWRGLVNPPPVTVNPL